MIFHEHFSISTFFTRSPTVPFHFRIALSLRPRRTIEFNVTIVIDPCVIMANIQLSILSPKLRISRFSLYLSATAYPRIYFHQSFLHWRRAPAHYRFNRSVSHQTGEKLDEITIDREGWNKIERVANRSAISDKCKSGSFVSAGVNRGFTSALFLSACRTTLNIKPPADNGISFTFMDDATRARAGFSL